MNDFIDRAKLEALAKERYPNMSGLHQSAIAVARGDFVAGAEAVLALLDAEATEEWGVQWESSKGEIFVNEYRTEGQARYDCYEDEKVVRRRIIRSPWLPSEGGEKP